MQILITAFWLLTQYEIYQLITYLSLNQFESITQRRNSLNPINCFMRRDISKTRFSKASRNLKLFIGFKSFLIFFM